MVDRQQAVRMARRTPFLQSELLSKKPHLKFCDIQTGLQIVRCFHSKQACEHRWISGFRFTTPIFWLLLNLEASALTFGSPYMYLPANCESYPVHVVVICWMLIWINWFLSKLLWLVVFSTILIFQRSGVLEQRNILLRKRQEEQRQREQLGKAQKEREYCFPQPKIKVRLGFFPYQTKWIHNNKIFSKLLP